MVILGLSCLSRNLPTTDALVSAAFVSSLYMPVSINAC